MSAPTPYHPPVKRSVEIAGHKTSVSLEPLFWDALRQAAQSEGLPINALVAQIDAQRIASPKPPGLASAIRLWLAARWLANDGQYGADQ
ncbi:ribbon-helix-helix domain-containing protein [Alteraurantiacibacter palmitatis]|uniref:Ribbon-helix-helix domain-containing protein n=1 Tax=Alteraurantiacibacter palmitatis TaxID=2054628 RepID=A0ABV7E997_9SPHN